MVLVFPFQDSSRQQPVIEPVIAFITLKELLGTPMSDASFDKEMQSFHAIQLLYFAAKVGLILINDGNKRWELNRALISEFLAPTLRNHCFKIQGQHIDQCTRAGYQPSIRPVFHSLQVLYFVRLILTGHLDKGTKPIDKALDNLSGPNAAFLLLACSDFIAQQCKTTRYETLKELIRSSLFIASSHHAQRLIGRIYRLFFLLGSKKKYRIFGKTVNRLFRDATGVSLANYFGMGCGLFDYFSRAILINRPTNIDVDENFLLNWNTYFSAIKAKKGERSKLFHLFCTSFSQAQQNISSSNLANPILVNYDLLPFIRFPLIEYSSGFVFPIHLPFLIEKFTYGLYWQIVNSISTNKRLYSEWQKQWGLIVQDYIWDIFCHNICPDKQVRKKFVFYDKKYGRGKGKAATDIIYFIADTKALYLFEVTASLMPINALMADENLADFSKGTDAIIYEKAKSLQKTIDAIKSGELVLNNISPQDIASFHPAIVTLKPYPVHPFLWRDQQDDKGNVVWIGIGTVLKRNGWLQGGDIAKLRIMDADEFEVLAVTHKLGYHFTKIIDEWTNNKHMSEESLKYFLYHNKDRLPSFPLVTDDFKLAQEFIAAKLFCEGVE